MPERILDSLIVNGISWRPEFRELRTASVRLNPANIGQRNVNLRILTTRPLMSRADA
ncbi:MAG: hypothetical protein U0936_13110 [Planctomycetaceae bacterium]